MKKLLILVSMQLFENTDIVDGFTQSELKQLPCSVTKQSYFIFNGFFYKQIDDLAMGSPRGSSLAYTFLSCHEKKLVKHLSARSQFFTDVMLIILLYTLNVHLKFFQDFLNSCHINMSFPIKAEKRTNYPFPKLKLCANKINLQPQFIKNLLLMAYIVTFFTFGL